MFNLGGLATLLHALVIAQIVIPTTVATPVDSTTLVAPTSHFQRSLPTRDDALEARVDCGNVPTYNAPAITDQDFPAYKADQAAVYRYRQQQSVNLGSWCVLPSSRRLNLPVNTKRVGSFTNPG